MSEQPCKDCEHTFKFHYKSNDDQTHCVECNKNVLIVVRLLNNVL